MFLPKIYSCCLHVPWAVMVSGRHDGDRLHSPGALQALFSRLAHSEANNLWDAFEEQQFCSWCCPWEVKDVGSKVLLNVSGLREVVSRGGKGPLGASKMCSGEALRATKQLAPGPELLLLHL